MFTQVFAGIVLLLDPHMPTRPANGPLQPAAASKARCRPMGSRSLLIVSTLLAIVGMPCRPLEAASTYDRVFLRHELQSSAYELDVARLGQARGQRPEVRAYAETLLDDHTPHDEVLSNLAGASGIDREPATEPSDQRRLARLRSTSDRRFDAAFLREARRINGDGVRAFRLAASRTTDPEIRSFILRFLEVDKKHDSVARSLSNIVMASQAVVRPPRTGDSMVVVPAPGNGSMPIIQTPSDGHNVLPSRN